MFSCFLCKGVCRRLWDRDEHLEKGAQSIFYFTPTFRSLALLPYLMAQCLCLFWTRVNLHIKLNSDILD